MPDKQVSISDAESRVMGVLWQRAPQSSEDIVAALQQPTGWHGKTIRTLLNRLLRKGAVSAQKDGRRFLYSPLLGREAWQLQESRSLLDRVFGGKIAPLLTHFSQHEALSAKDVAELRKLLDAIEKRSR
ncbi:BlaI/MecI/CopY family transcriptional regulator [Rhodanobacter umsongensis]|uniref:BlaI/MecI/CopY family transcriptional regulator n=1 Tax=Rhodanobacter umsongensis TaxID=633153 RepID=A0ABW0JQ56_9GAMM